MQRLLEEQGQPAPPPLGLSLGGVLWFYCGDSVSVSLPRPAWPTWEWGWGQRNRLKEGKKKIDQLHIFLAGLCSAVQACKT